MPLTTDMYWKRKLSAYLHDSPDKVLSIVDHELRARRIAGEIPGDEMSRKEADWAASAADRLPFPPSSQSRTELSRFTHPLGGSHWPLDPKAMALGVAEDTSQTTRPRLNEDDPRAAFITTWRFWRNWASSRHPDFALYPAETRLPDHTIWNHLAVTSAMQGCFGGNFLEYVEAKKRQQTPSPPPDSPAFLLFTIGPVQDFIAAARSTRDLWSGSYLLSYLIGHALRRISLDFGPDHVLFPNLCDQPIMDLLLRDEIWDKVSTVDGQVLFSAFRYYEDDAKQRLLTPSLPNRFLAALPARMKEHQDRGPQFASAESYARALAQDVRRFLKEHVAEPVAKVCRDALGARFNSDRFDQQVASMLEVHWQVLPWPETFEDVEAWARLLPPDDAGKEYTPRAGLETILELCNKGADTRYLVSRDRREPKSVAAGWSALYSVAEWLLDGSKANRAFRPSQGGDINPSNENTKDSLNGREEAVLRVRADSEEGEDSDEDELSKRIAQVLGKERLLKAGESLGASTLIKRIWPYAVLCKRHSFKPNDLAMPNTRGIAAREPWQDDDGLDDDKGRPYFAVLALDGDSMGKWIGGSKAPPLADVLSGECAAAFREKGSDLQGKRPLSPSWHLQFSEALGNFSLHAARRVVESYDGRLIYAGGDDVLAMLPAETAIPCAEALRMAFRGDPRLNDKAKGIPCTSGSGSKTRKSDRQTPLFHITRHGFLQLAPESGARHGTTAGLLDDPVSFPAVVPGPNADCSVGIAIAHFASPLQDVVRAARLAEKRAKDMPGKAALSVSLFKRSGETVEWTCKWDSGGIEVFDAMLDAITTEGVGSRFPYRLVEILGKYVTGASAIQSGALESINDFPMEQVVQREGLHVLDRQGERKESESYQTLHQMFQSLNDPAASRLAGYLASFKNRAVDRLTKAMEDRDEWAKASKANELRKQRLRSAVTSDPIQALINLCQTVAFIRRNGEEENA